MKKRYAFFAICILFSVISLAQSPQYAWAKNAGGASYEEGQSCSTDASGNILVTGFFQSASITFGTTTLTNADSGTADMFIVKYDPSGNVLWAKSAGGISDDVGQGCTVDATGNILVTGFFWSNTIIFGTTTLTSAGNKDMFLAKYDPNGNVLWAKSAGGNDDDRGLACSTDANGNSIVTGSFQSTSIQFGTTTFTNANSGNADMFIVKYDALGNVLWAKSAGGTADDAGLSCTTISNGNIFVTGYFYSPAITFGSITLTNAGVSDMFILKYDASGNVLWAKNAGGPSYEYGNSCAADANGNVTVTGYFQSASIILGNDTLANAGGNDMFIAKYDASGNVLWAKSAGGTMSDYGAACAIDASGNVLVTGYFSSPSITFGSTTLARAGNYDVFIVDYDASGHVLWAKSAGGAAADLGLSCATDANGNMLITGYFSSSSISFGTTTLTNTGGYDMFLVKLDKSTLTGISPITNFTPQLDVYPNPSSGVCFLSLPFCPGEATVEVYSSSGERIYSSSLQGRGQSQLTGKTQWVLDLSEMKNGIYFLRLKTKEGIAAKTFVLQK